MAQSPRWILLTSLAIFTLVCLKHNRLQLRSLTSDASYRLYFSPATPTAGDVDWSRVLHFVPRGQTVTNCDRWGEQRLDDPTMTPFRHTYARYQQYYKDFESQLKVFESQGLERCPRVEGRTKQIRTYLELGRLDFVKVVCEIGFNAGHSAVTWMAARPNIRLYTFDIATHTITKPMANYFQRKYPGRFHITYGDSLEVVPQWTKTGIKCDIVSIDGSHAYEFAKADIINMRPAANRKHILVLDDTLVFKSVAKAWRELIVSGVIIPKAECQNTFSIAIGHYNISPLHTGNTIDADDVLLHGLGENKEDELFYQPDSDI